MDEPEWVDAFGGSSVADEVWLAQLRAGTLTNGSTPYDQEDSWTPRNLAELEDKPPVEPTLGGLSLCYPGKRHVFSGPQESAKTLAAYVIGLSVVRSGSSVVLIDFEMGPWDAKTRLRELGATNEELAMVAYVEPETPPTQETSVRLAALEPGLVIVDAAAGAFELGGMDDNSRKDVEKWASAWVWPFWKAGIATIVLDHVTKNAETRGNYAIGSERKVGGADVHLGFSVITPIRRGGHGKYQVTTHKDRGGCLKRGKLATFELESDPDTNVIEWSFVPAQEHDDEHPFRPTHLMEKVSRWLELQPETVTQNDVEREKFGKRDYVREALRILVDEGFITKTEGPNRSYLYECARAYREDMDESSGAPPSAPQYAPETEQSGAPVRPTPYRGGAHAANLLDEGAPDDDIPF